MLAIACDWIGALLALFVLKPLRRDWLETHKPAIPVRPWVSRTTNFRSINFVCEGLMRSRFREYRINRQRPIPMGASNVMGAMSSGFLKRLVRALHYILP